MSNRIHKSRIDEIEKESLHSEAHKVLIEAKNNIRCGKTFEIFRNGDDTRGGGPPLPKLPVGCCYMELQVGNARAGDRRRAGTRRLVLAVHQKSRKVLEAYYTEEHYEKFSFVRIRNA
jgi:guanyl-specific ribonuclease Sa